MPADERYRRQVALCVRVLPLVSEETCLAVRGGTTISPFVGDPPRSPTVQGSTAIFRRASLAASPRPNGS